MSTFILISAFLSNNYITDTKMWCNGKQIICIPTLITSRLLCISDCLLGIEKMWDDQSTSSLITPLNLNWRVATLWNTCWCEKLPVYHFMLSKIERYFLYLYFNPFDNYNKPVYIKSRSSVFIRSDKSISKVQSLWNLKMKYVLCRL